MVQYKIIFLKGLNTIESKILSIALSDIIIKTFVSPRINSFFLEKCKEKKKKLRPVYSFDYGNNYSSLKR